MKLGSLFAAGLVLSLVFFAATAYAAPLSAEDATTGSGSQSTTTSTVCEPGENPFTVTGSAWGTLGSPASVSPGDQNVPMTVTLLYSDSCGLTAASFELKLSQPFISASGQNYSTAYAVNISPYSVLSETYYLSINANASLATYSIPLYIGYNTSSYSGIFFQSTGAVISLRGSVKLSFASNVTTLYAGVVNNLTVSISNVGTGRATSINPSVSATAQVSILNQLSSIQSLSPNATVSQALKVYVPSSDSGAAIVLSFSAGYYDAYSISRSVAQVLGFSVSAYVSQSQLRELASPFVVEGIQWGTSGLSPQPGDSNVPLIVDLQYIGTATAVDLQETLGLPTGFTAQNGGSRVTAYTPTVNPNQAIQVTFDLNIGSAVAQGSYNFPVELQWVTATSTGLGENVTLSPPAIGQSIGSSGVSLSLVQVNNTVIMGTQSRITFILTNVGTESIYSVVFSLAATSPLVLMNSSPSTPLAVIRSGQSVSYSATVASSPSATVGIYGGALSVAFADFGGVQHAQSFSAGFILMGSVDFVVQDEEISQSSSSVTVSGSLLNEGTTPAYYTQVLGSIDGASTGNESAYYVGEVDPNTPTTFSVTIPFAAPSTPNPDAVVGLSLTYKNSFGTVATSQVSTKTSLESAEQLFLATATETTTGQSSSGQELVTLASYAIIAVVAVAVVISAVVVRRRRSATSPKKQEKVI